MENKITNEYLESINSTIRIDAVKLVCKCIACKRKYSIYFSNLEELITELPEDWNICLSCNPTPKKSIDSRGYAQVRGGE